MPVTTEIYGKIQQGQNFILCPHSKWMPCSSCSGSSARLLKKSVAGTEQKFGGKKGEGMK